MTETILAVVNDLIFLSKIQQAARQTGVSVEAVEPKSLENRMAEVPARAVILDLNHRSGSALEILRAMKSSSLTRSVYVLGFVSHVQGDVIAAARQAGCDQVLARSAFSEQLPQLLEKLASKEPEDVGGG